MIAATTRTLVARLAELLAREHVALADFLVTLADFDRERRWEEYGYANLYDFLVRELGMSKGTAFYRKVAVALVQGYPEVLEPLRDGRLCITAVHALSKVITPENRAEVLPRFLNVSKQEAKAISAEIAPAVEVPRREVVTTVRAAPALDMGHVPNRLVNRTGTEPATPPVVAPLDLAPALRPSRPTLEPLTADEHRLHLTVSPEFLNMLDSCKKALSHAMPGADAADVLAEGMRLILARDAKRKGLVERPRARKAGQPCLDSRNAPAEIERAVWKRDQGKCQWPVEGGGICGSEIRPELDHIRGFRPGEPVTADDFRILCRPHNLAHARQVYGDDYMEGFRRRGRSGGSRRARPCTSERPPH